MFLKMFTNGADYVIAESVEAAKEICVKDFGYDADEIEETEFEEMDPGKEFTLRNDDDGSKETRTVAAWIEECGSCYFANSEN